MYAGIKQRGHADGNRNRTLPVMDATLVEVPAYEPEA